MLSFRDSEAYVVDNNSVELHFTCRKNFLFSFLSIYGRSNSGFLLLKDPDLSAFSFFLKYIKWSFPLNNDRY